MRKKAFLACMLVVSMLLTGCALIEKDSSVDLAREVIRVSNPAGGEDIVYTKSQVLNQVNYQLNYMSYLYSMLGYNYDTTSATVIAEAKDSVMNSLVSDAVLTLKAHELGMYDFTDEELAEIESAADENWTSIKSSVQSQYFADTELTGDELDAAVEAKTTELGYTRDLYVENQKTTKALDKLKGSITSTVEISEDELKTGFDEKVAEQKATYDATPTSYVTAKNNGTTVYYAPAGVRMVKQILLKFSDEDQATIDALNSAISDKNTAISTLTSSLNTALGTDAGVTADELVEQVSVTLEAPAAAPAEDVATATDLATASDLPVSTVATVTDLTANFTAEVSEDAQDLAKQLAQAKAELSFYQEQLAQAKENGWNHLSAQADEILEKLNAGADFDALIDEYNQDSGMAADATARKNGGYAVCEGYTSFDSDFLAAALALEKVGDVSGKVNTQFGTHILQYTSDVTEGAVELDTIRDVLQSELLSTKQNEVYDAQEKTWVSEAKVTTNRALLDD